MSATRRSLVHCHVPRMLEQSEEEEQNEQETKTGQPGRNGTLKLPCSSGPSIRSLDEKWRRAQSSVMRYQPSRVRSVQSDDFRQSQRILFNVEVILLVRSRLSQNLENEGDPAVRRAKDYVVDGGVRREELGERENESDQLRRARSHRSRAGVLT